MRRITCLTREDETDCEPEDVLRRIETAKKSAHSVIKEIRKSRDVKRTLKVHMEPWGDLCLHEYRWNLKRVVLSPFRISKGRKIWVYYEGLRRKNISVPEPVFFLEIKVLFVVIRTYIATRWIAEGTKLSQLAAKKDIHPDHFRTILCKCVNAVINLHESGFVHGDLKWSNLLIVPGKDAVVFTDIDALRKTSDPLSQCKDFARIFRPPSRCRLDSGTAEMMLLQYLSGRSSLGDPLLEKRLRFYIARQKSRRNDQFL